MQLRRLPSCFLILFKINFAASKIKLADFLIRPFAICVLPTPASPLIYKGRSKVYIKESVVTKFVSEM
ncbi:hypothetical protein A9Q85_00675 [Cycloclasticus sp. 44_32_T64]|nr:hypothetical protein A9Q85_00675 [Cycloclasticus sp. 44_32_T64]